MAKIDYEYGVGAGEPEQDTTSDEGKGYEFGAPGPDILVGDTEAAAGLSIPIAMHHYKQMMGAN